MTTDAQLQRNLHALVDDIVKGVSDPAWWPLEPSSQIAFVRRTIGMALQIAHSEPYLADAVRIAAKDAADAGVCP